MLAVIKTGGKQYTVTEKQILRVEKLPQQNRKDNRVIFSDILLVAKDSASVAVGKPVVANAIVEATVLQDAKSRKVTVVKYKPKVRYRRTRGHRQPYSEVRIDRIVVS